MAHTLGGRIPGTLCAAQQSRDPTQEVNGTAGRIAVRARTAVPCTLNSVPPDGNGLTLSFIPTIPSPPAGLHSSTARDIASLRTPYRFLCSALNGPAAAEARSVGADLEDELRHLPTRLTKPR